ncbi:MAG: septal ring lytic transglycosylase RlpA family protein [Alphaproteobacteria bacterium]|nr:septal ring lytic transglycosylase RlpA family protein [Alphaproteobacteria bacterium]
MPPISKALTLIVALTLLSACAGGKGAPLKPREGEKAGHFKIGNPYQINGQWYYPREDYSYDETGIASWYGTEFQGVARTANGEIFNKDELTAAHKTLPLPSLARVTNLENGKSVVVRINDRGPFSGARIIDVSQRVSQMLDFERQGTAKVRVQVLADESKAIADAMRHYGSSSQVAGSPSSLPPPQNIETASITKVTSAPLSASSGIGNVKPVQVVNQLTMSGSNQIYIQAGAYSSMDNARKMQLQLSSIGTARITEAVVKGTKFFRVRLGPVKNVPKADKMLKTVTGAGVRGARIVVE